MIAMHTPGLEESERFPQRIFYDALPKKYLPLGLVFGPQDLGWPIRRSRFYSACINQETIVWLGPRSSDAVLQDFIQIFGHLVVMEADEFLKVGEEEEHDKIIKDYASRRGLYADLAKLKSLPRESIFSPGQARHYKEYKDLMRQGRFVGVRGSFVCDLAQDPSERPRAGAWLPSLVKSSLMYSMSKDKFFTNAQLDFSMGFPVHPQMSACYRECLGFNVHHLEKHAYQKLIGNGMHCCAIFCWWMYVFNNSVRRTDVERWAPGLLVSVPAPSMTDNNETSQPTDARREE